MQMGMRMKRINESKCQRSEIRLLYYVNNNLK